MNVRTNMQFPHMLARFPLAWGARVSSLAFGSWHSDAVAHRSAQRLAARASITLEKQEKRN